VNNLGDIVGYGLTMSGDIRGFVIEGFVPTPATAMLLGAGFPFASRRRR
jgi:hypothetical protein